MAKKDTPFNKSFRKEYALALRIGDKRFGSPCEHRNTRKGKCLDCFRKVVS